MKINYLFLLCAILLFTGCSRIIPMSGEYYKAPTTIGILVISQDIDMARTGSQGLLDYAVTPGNRFIEGLETIEDDVEPKATITNVYEKVFEANGKKYIVIDDEVFLNRMARSGKSGKKYSEYNFATLKEKYNIDELLFVKLRHGLMVSYYSFIELDKTGYCNIVSEIVNIDDSSVSFRNVNLRTAKMEGKWNGGENYSYLKEAILKATELAVEEEQRAMRGTQR